VSGCILFDEDCFVVARSLYVVKIRISIVLYNSSVNTCGLFLGAACQQTVHDFLLSSLLYSHLATASASGESSWILGKIPTYEKCAMYRNQIFQ
jgi:hypothetical protein